MPQAMVPSGRKCPPMRSVMKPSDSATAAVSAMPMNSVSQGETPYTVVSQAVV